MRIKETKSLLWLSRWYNGRSQQLMALYDDHESTLKAVVLERLGKRKFCKRRVIEVCGITLTVSYSKDQGLTIHSISGPETYRGSQPDLFVHRAWPKQKSLEVAA